MDSAGQYDERRRAFTGKCPTCGDPVDLENRSEEWFRVERTNTRRMRRRRMRGGPRRPLRQTRRWEHARFDSAAYGAHCDMMLIGGYDYAGRVEVDAVGPLE